MESDCCSPTLHDYIMMLQMQGLGIKEETLSQLIASVLRSAHDSELGSAFQQMLRAVST